MNAEKWDQIAEAFASGTLVPANGLDAWTANARREAELIKSIAPPRTTTLLEVGCGIGRLTPHLARLFPTVQAIDTSPRCRAVTRAVCNGMPNVTVVRPGEEASARLALVWGNLYDEDWSDAAAVDHITELLTKHLRVLVQTTRAAIRATYRPLAENAGDDWLLVK